MKHGKYETEWYMVRILFSDKEAPYQPNHKLPCTLHNIAQLPEAVSFMDLLLCKMLHHTSSSFYYTTTNHNIVQYLKQTRYSCTRLSTTLHHVCGNIVSSTDESTCKLRVWHIEPLAEYNTILIFNAFNMMYSKNCSINSLAVSRISDCVHKELYCGHLPPWNESCPSAKINLTLQINWLQSPTHLNTSYYISKHISATIYQHIQFFTTTNYALDVLFPSVSDVELEILLLVQASRINLIAISIKHLPDVSNISHSHGKNKFTVYCICCRSIIILKLVIVFVCLVLSNLSLMGWC